MRIVRHKPVELTSRHIVCQSTFSWRLAVFFMVVGAIGVGSSQLWHLPRNAVPTFVAFVAMPSCGAILLGIVLAGYRERVEIDVPRGLVMARESLLRLPLRSRRRLLHDFETVKVRVEVSGHEGSPARYYVVILHGPDGDIVLFDLDDYAEAVRTARRLTSHLGLGGERTQSGA